MIQIDMDMPSCCLYCPMLHRFGKRWYCGIKKKEIHDILKRPKSCPLIEVKEGCEQKMTHQELMIECDMLQGNVNRMMVTKDIRELVRMHEFAEMRLQKIHKWRVKELVAKMEKGE